MTSIKFEILILFFLLSTIWVTNISAPPSPVTLSNIEIVTLNEEYASVTWVTNIQTDTTVQWGTTQDLGEEYHLEESTNYHMGKMEGLSQGTTYYFRVGSNDVFSDISSLTTLTDPGGDLMATFAIVADPHYDVDGSNTANGNMYEDGPRLLSTLVSELNNDLTIDFVITLGDLTNGAEEDYSGFVTTMNDLNIPWYPVLGNWDKDEDNWATFYNDHMGRTDTYYSLDYGGYHLVVLDSAVPGQIGGDFDEDQMKWLESDLDAYPDSPTLIFMHHMADRTDEIFGIESQAQVRLGGILSTRSQVLTIHSGHIHQNILTYLDDHRNLAIAAVVQYPMGYDIVKLYEGGYTQTFYKIEDELETSEESRVRINTNSGDPDADEDYLGEISERSMVVHIPGNDPPEISKIDVDMDTVKPEGTVEIIVTASDPEGKPLIYNYAPSDGIITGAGSQVTWTAPDKSGECVIQIWVSDGEKNSNKESVMITVSGGVKGDGDNSTPGFDPIVLILSTVSLAIGLRKIKKF
jgi:hypothetical protein